MVNRSKAKGARSLSKDQGANLKARSLGEAQETDLEARSLSSVQEAPQKARSLNFPVYAVIPLVVIIAAHYLTYDLGAWIGSYFPGSSLELHIDTILPFVPVWILIYIAAYPFCLLNDILASYADRKRFFAFCTAYLLIHIITMVLFAVFPVFVDRPDVSQSGILYDLVRAMYESDLSGNCFPSLHCGLAVLAFLGIYKVKKIPKAYQWFSLVFAILICFSTLFTKEHFLADALAGVALAIFLYYGSLRFRWYVPVERAFNWINQRIWGNVIQNENS